MDILRVRNKRKKSKRFAEWVFYLFRNYNEATGWERIEDTGYDIGEHVTPPWQQEVASCIVFVRSFCGSVPLEDPTVASLCFVKFLKVEGNPYLRRLENYAKKHTIINDTIPKPQEENVGNGIGAPTGAATTEPSAGCESATRVTHKHEVKSNLFMGAGADVDSQSPSGDEKVCFARHDDRERSRERERRLSASVANRRAPPAPSGNEIAPATSAAATLGGPATAPTISIEQMFATMTGRSVDALRRRPENKGTPSEQGPSAEHKGDGGRLAREADESAGTSAAPPPPSPGVKASHRSPGPGKAPAPGNLGPGKAALHGATGEAYVVRISML